MCAPPGRLHFDSRARATKVLFQQKCKPSLGGLHSIQIRCEHPLMKPEIKEVAQEKKKYTPKFAYPKLDGGQTSARVVAIGDLHGDMDQAIRSLKIANVVRQDAQRPEQVHWTGGNTHLVQLGDVLDRGDDEISILLLLQKLQTEAKEAGGAVHLLNGNHEVLNIAGDFRYVTQGAFVESEQFSDTLEERFGCSMSDGVPCDIMAPNHDPMLKYSLGYKQDVYDKRVGLYAPGGTVAQTLSRSHTVLVVNDTCFVHGGLRRRHIDFGLDKLNMRLSAWMRGEPKGDIPDIEEALFMAAGSSNSAVWCRTWSEEFITRQKRVIGCIELQAVLQGVSDEVGRPVTRMVMGHTVQRQGINQEYRGMAWRIDVGASRGVAGASPEVLEVVDGEVNILRAELPILLGRGFPERPDIEFPEANACSLIDHAHFLRSELPVRDPEATNPKA
eukprot:CAMPEP_0198199752 /NCGR_PEP_ID=MMETSP1445-20131203/2930_1 /TAXON_ID=36898 /ORGANISM="Pyramimonas sp., Strain CCMP2087" /LENGTH=443 /DNA_ID=CAMNT_0043869643 /DNA_START=195 /DNA_END=1526 /DNA_ORIENTATION=+